MSDLVILWDSLSSISAAIRRFFSIVHGQYLPDESLLHIHEKKKCRLVKSVLQIYFANVLVRVLRAQGDNFLEKTFSTLPICELIQNLAVQNLFVLIGFVGR